MKLGLDTWAVRNGTCFLNSSIRRGIGMESKWEEKNKKRNVSLSPFSLKCFTNFFFCGSLRISLSTGKDACRGKVAYIWIFPNPAKAGCTLGGIVVMKCKKKQIADP